MYIIYKYEVMADFNMVVAKVDHQTTKFDSPPNFLAIYTVYYAMYYV